MKSWNDTFSERRSGSTSRVVASRTAYQKDFDRLIFSSSFRRLQNKTQVFPLPGSTFVHNRLTHSLEVASVGRSLGKLVGDNLAESGLISGDDTLHFFRYDLSNVIAAACLAHDIGNPAFGHSGEKAISNYFLSNADSTINNSVLRSYFTDKEWEDLINFEGNANALRVLTHHYRNKAKGGMRLTMSTLASIIKYPCESVATDKSKPHTKKYGFFQTEKDTFRQIMQQFDIKNESLEPLIFKRHPFVYLVEAADDICYRIVDMEDAHRLDIVTRDEVSNLFLKVINQLSPSDYQSTADTYNKIQDHNDSIAYLRAMVINTLTEHCARLFYNKQEELIAGDFSSTLIQELEKDCPSLLQIVDLSVSKIYNHHSVVEIEITGYHVMSHLLKLFVPAVLRSEPNGLDKMALKLLPRQFREYEITDRPFEKVLSVVDYISGMTDRYATEFYRKTTGIDISSHR